MNESLKHHGVLGQKWGVRRYQPYPKSYTGDGKFIDENGIKYGTKKDIKQYKKGVIKNYKKNAKFTNAEGFVAKTYLDDMKRQESKAWKLRAKVETNPTQKNISTYNKQVDEYIAAKEKYNKAAFGFNFSKERQQAVYNIIKNDYGNVKLKNVPKDIQEAAKSYSDTRLKRSLLAGIPIDAIYTLKEIKKVEDINKTLPNWKEEDYKIYLKTEKHDS